MNLPTVKRPLHREEIRLLRKVQSKAAAKIRSKKPYVYFSYMLLTGIAAAYLASITKTDFWFFILITWVVIAGMAIVFVISPYHIKKGHRKLKQQIKQANHYLTENELTVTPINSLRVAIGEEYEDESELYFIEYQPGWILCIWDNSYDLSEKLLCQQFEIYDKTFSQLISIEVFTLPSTPKLEPVRINGKAKWDYLGKYGPGHLQTEQISFEVLLERFDSFSKKPH